MERAVTDRRIFSEMQTRLDNRFNELTEDVEQKIRSANREHLLAVRVALDALRDENVVHEAEQYPEFRERLCELLPTAQSVVDETSRAAM